MRVLVVVCLLAALALASADSQSKNLTSFKSLTDATPFNGDVDVGTKNEWTVNITGPAAQVKEFSVQQVGSAVTLTTTTGIVITDANPANNAIYSLRVPPSGANAITSFVASGSGNHTLGGAALSNGSTPFSLTNSGSGVVSILNLATSSLALNASGSGIIVVTGKSQLQTVTVTSNGSEDIYVSGVAGTVQINSVGAGNINIVASSPNVKITGSSAGAATIYYTQGSCSVTGCQRQQSIRMPGS